MHAPTPQPSLCLVMALQTTMQLMLVDACISTQELLQTLKCKTNGLRANESPILLPAACNQYNLHVTLGTAA